MVRIQVSQPKWTDGRAVDGTGLENQQGAIPLGFESLSVRHNKIVYDFVDKFLGPVA